MFGQLISCKHTQCDGHFNYQLQTYKSSIVLDQRMHSKFHPTLSNLSTAENGIVAFAQSIIHTSSAVAVKVSRMNTADSPPLSGLYLEHEGLHDK